ncbi:MAG: hypothetical protein Q8K85_21225 [Hyphomicrobium sp.]|nr:hypothetical protein [Hyphomicrobium sp.]
MIKEAYTKDELRFIDNCSLALSENRVFDNDIGHILTIDIDKSVYSREYFKSYLFMMEFNKFEDFKNKFEELIIASKKVKQLHKELEDMHMRVIF